MIKKIQNMPYLNCIYWHLSKLLYLKNNPYSWKLVLLKSYKIIIIKNARSTSSIKISVIINFFAYCNSIILLHNLWHSSKYLWKKTPWMLEKGPICYMYIQLNIYYLLYIRPWFVLMMSIYDAFVKICWIINC